MPLKTCTGTTAVAMLLLVLSLDASEPKYSDARSDGFLGPIRSVSTKEERVRIEWHQPDGPTVALSAGCPECEYDLEGNRVKTGQTIDGEWRGDTMRLMRDSAGKVIEKIAENYKGEVYSREVLGPYGIQEEDLFKDGNRISQSLWFYDSDGHVSEYRNYGQDGVIGARSFSVSDAAGNRKEQWDYRADGVFSLHFLEVNDPQTDTYIFTNFNEDGSMKVTFTTKGTKLISYWQEPSERPVFGSTFFMDPVGKTQESYTCHSDSNCDHIISFFTDETRRNASRVEWHDAEGILKLWADYDYEIDQFGNWSKRTVWVGSSELEGRKLYETDYRTLTYWNR